MHRHSTKHTVALLSAAGSAAWPLTPALHPMWPANHRCNASVIDPRSRSAAAAARRGPTDRQHRWRVMCVRGARRRPLVICDVNQSGEFTSESAQLITPIPIRSPRPAHLLRLRYRHRRPVLVLSQAHSQNNRCSKSRVTWHHIASSKDHRSVKEKHYYRRPS